MAMPSNVFPSIAKCEERSLESLQIQEGKVLDCFKQSLMGNSGGNSEDQNVKRQWTLKMILMRVRGKG